MGQKKDGSLNHEREKVQDQRDSEQAQKRKQKFEFKNITVREHLKSNKTEDQTTEKRKIEEGTEEMERHYSSKEEKTDDPG